MIKNEMSEEGIRVAFTIVRDVCVKDRDPTLDEEISRVEERVRNTYKLEELKNLKEIRAYRDFYWRIGIDPTKTRPSAEALLRRVVRGQRLPKINNVVDVGNLVSLLTLIPIGIYDLDKIKGELRLRRARKGERFRPIGGKEITLKGGEPVLADEEKILHLFPHRDSVDTMVRSDTRNVLIVAAGVPGIEEERLKEAANKVAELLEKYACGRREGDARVV